MKYSKCWYGKSAKTFTFKKKGFAKLQTLTGGEMNVFLELLVLIQPRMEFDGLVCILVMSFDKKRIAKKFGYNSPQVIDNYLQRLIKKGVLHRMSERQYFEVDSDILAGVSEK